MSADQSAVGQHPAPRRHDVAIGVAAFGIIAGPLAWFAQLCAGYALATWPCFPHDHRTLAPLAGYAWTRTGIFIVLFAGVATALAALVISWRSYRRTRGEAAGDHQQLMETGDGRTRFLAFWGVLLSGGAAVATCVTIVALIVLPRCAG